MAAWDVHEGAIEGRRVAKLEALVREMVGAAHTEDEMSIFIGYDEFEQLVKEVRRRGALLGRETKENRAVHGTSTIPPMRSVTTSSSHTRARKRTLESLRTNIMPCPGYTGELQK